MLIKIFELLKGVGNDYRVHQIIDFVFGNGIDIFPIFFIVKTHNYIGDFLRDRLKIDNVIAKMQVHKTEGHFQVILAFLPFAKVGSDIFFYRIIIKHFSCKWLKIFIG